MKTYYFPNPEFNDSFFGGSDAVCVDHAEALRLASEWDMTETEIMEQLHEATADEISEYGVYDSHRKWYAVMRDSEDNDWGYGSHNLAEAKAMVKKYPEGYIAVIDEDTNTCIDEIH